MKTAFISFLAFAYFVRPSDVRGIQATAQAGSVSAVEFTESRQRVRAFSAFGETSLPSVRVQVDVPDSDNAEKNERGDVLIVYNPETGHYLWRYHAFNSPGDTYSFLEAATSGREALYVEKDRILSFVTGWPWITEYHDRAESLDAAKVAVFGWLERGHPTLSKAGGKVGPAPLDLSKGQTLGPIPREFFCGPEPRRSDCPQGDRTQIVSISKQGENWRLVRRNHWDQETILDAKFNPLSTRRLPEPLR
jgi:hypothetical protein